MNSSPARIAANRRNAALSTGPKTPEGKAKSRANALKHGLCSTVVEPKDLELVRKRSSEIFDTFKPQNVWQAYLVEKVAEDSVRLDHCTRMERLTRDKLSIRAELMWDDDRRLEVEIMAKSLAKDPTTTVEALQRTPHGCDWMIRRWSMLAYSADTQGTWTEEQTRLAFDLMATPEPFRDSGRPGIVIDHHGRVIDVGEDLAAVARREVDRLIEHRAIVAELDDVQRALASANLSNEGDPELRRLHRYENSLHAKIRWSLAQIQEQSPQSRPNPSPRPRISTRSRHNPEIETLPQPATAIKPRPTVIDQAQVDVLAADPASADPKWQNRLKTALEQVPPSRLEKRLLKAESRREQKRRKADKLRA